MKMCYEDVNKSEHQMLSNLSYSLLWFNCEINY